MASDTKILLVEDDANFGLVLKDHLQMQGFDVTLCVDGEEGICAYHKASFDLCLVDVMMPKKDGFTFAKEVRQTNEEIPLIFLTAKSLTEDKIKGFNLGCDDYITKPFSIEELMLRIQAVLKRTGRTSSETELPTEFILGDFTFDYTRQQLLINNKSQKLTPKESDLLRLLCLNVNHVLSRNTALRKIWGDDNYFSGRSMDVFISKLRKHLKADPKIEIMGIHGKGFRLVVNK
ncbi:MAG: response regulator transcription factor [candidate division Zixibacteria bacterium]|nr:response regulator transcription factor [candidate division Zixibacteria bacterium]